MHRSHARYMNLGQILVDSLATSSANFLFNIEEFFFALQRFIRGDKNLVTVKTQAIVITNYA